MNSEKSSNVSSFANKCFLVLGNSFRLYCFIQSSYAMCKNVTCEDWGENRPLTTSLFRYWHCSIPSITQKHYQERCCACCRSHLLFSSIVSLSQVFLQQLPRTTSSLHRAYSRACAFSSANSYFVDSLTSFLDILILMWWLSWWFCNFFFRQTKLEHLVKLDKMCMDINDL